MAAKNRTSKARKAAENAWGNPYLRRFMEDPELRDNVREAVQRGRKAYGRLSNGKAPTKQLIEDKKLHKELKQAAESLQNATKALQGKRKRKRRRLSKLLLLAVISGGVALALSEDLRNKVLDQLFGAEEEFDYSSSTTPAPAPEPEAASTS